jgi:hypothetical protein
MGEGPAAVLCSSMKGMRQLLPLATNDVGGTFSEVRLPKYFTWTRERVRGRQRLLART